MMNITSWHIVPPSITSKVTGYCEKCSTEYSKIWHHGECPNDIKK